MGKRATQGNSVNSKLLAVFQNLPHLAKEEKQSVDGKV